MTTEPEDVLALLDGDLPDLVGAIRPATTYRATAAGPSYRRGWHPGLVGVEQVAAALDGGRRALGFSSGMGAVASLLETLPGAARVVAPAVCYHGTRVWLQHLASTGRISLTLVSGSDPSRWAEAAAGAVDIVWAEPITNPTWDVLDLSALATVAHEAGGHLVVDATATPLTTQPLEHGADLVVHSGSKAYNGHSDVHAGFVVGSLAGDWWHRLEEIRALMGTILGPWDAWLLARGMRTITLRVDRTSETAHLLAERLDSHPAVGRVRYPGLPTHPGHAVARRQMTRGFGSMISIDVAGGAGAAARVVGAVRLWTPATSLGGVESLIEHRAPVEPPDSPIPDDLLRLSVGIEGVDALWDDLDAALAASRV